MAQVSDSARSLNQYMFKLHTKSESSRDITVTAVRHLQSLIQDQYGKPEDEFFTRLNMKDPRPKERAIYDLLQRYINHLDGKIQPQSVKILFSNLKPYISYRTETRIYDEDVKQYLQFRKIPKERRHVMSKDEAFNLIDNSVGLHKAIYLTKISSGLAIGEIMQLRKRDISTISFNNETRYMLDIPPSYRKVKVGKITFASKEAERYLTPLLNSIGQDDTLFATSSKLKYDIITEERYFDRLRERLGLTAKYDSGTHKLTIHTFRSYFISKCEKINSGLGHALAGHEKYMKIYERFSNEELLEFYLKAEPELTVLGITHQPINDDLAQQNKMLEMRLVQQKEMYEEQIRKLNQEIILNSVSSLHL